MDANERIHEQLKRAGVTLAASLPDDWVAPLINRIAADNTMQHVSVARESPGDRDLQRGFLGVFVRWR